MQTRAVAAIAAAAGELAPSTPCHLLELASDVRAYRDASMAESTRRAYASDWADFAGWCAGLGQAPPPASAELVAVYLARAAKAQLSVSTLARRLAAIADHHRRAGFDPPSGAALDEVWAGIRRTHGRPPTKKRAMVVDLLKRLLAETEEGPAGVRDRAVLLITFGAALRRSEASALDLEGPGSGPLRLAFVDGGLEVRIGRAKTDQTGQGAIVGVPFGRTTETCPVAAARAWLTLAGITEGAIFRTVDRWGRIGARRMSGAAVADVVKRAAERAGLDPAEFGGHSPRRGLITSAIVKGVSPEVVMRQSRHARFDTMRGYIEEAERFKRNAARKLL